MSRAVLANRTVHLKVEPARREARPVNYHIVLKQSSSAITTAGSPERKSASTTRASTSPLLASHPPCVSSTTVRISGWGGGAWRALNEAKKPARRSMMRPASAWRAKEWMGQEPGCQKLRGHRQATAVAKARQGQTVTPADAGLLEDVLQVDLDRARLNAKVHCDFFILVALLDQL